MLIVNWMQFTKITQIVAFRMYDFFFIALSFFLPFSFKLKMAAGGQPWMDEEEG